MGGSWSGPKDLKKDAEIYDATAGTWTLLPGIQAALILTDDPEDKEKGTYRADNYGWFFSWSNGTGVLSDAPCTPCKSPHDAVLRAVPETGSNTQSISTRMIALVFLVNDDASQTLCDPAMQCSMPGPALACTGLTLRDKALC